MIFISSRDPYVVAVRKAAIFRRGHQCGPGAPIVRFDRLSNGGRIARGVIDDEGAYIDSGLRSLRSDRSEAVDRQRRALVADDHHRDIEYSHFTPAAALSGSSSRNTVVIKKALKITHRVIFSAILPGESQAGIAHPLQK